MNYFRMNDLVRVTVPGLFRDALAVILQQGTGSECELYEVRTVRRGTVVWVHYEHIRLAPPEDHRR